MKGLFVFATAIATAFAEFTPELIEKYSIQTLVDGEADTQPAVGDQVSMHYAGELEDGTKFDSSYDRGTPLDIRIGRGQVITCWD